MSGGSGGSGVIYFCYLLTSRDPKYKNHTYVGFTVNPKRRIRQHNGELTNGAKRTTRKRPWEMVVTVHGFPTKTLALQFEWILQHPRESKRFRDVASNLKKIGHLYFLKAKLRFLMEMLHIAPFHMLPLTVHWFTDKYNHLLVDCPPLPAHIRANLGPLEELATNDFIDSDEDKEVESNSDMSDSEINCEEEAREVMSLRCHVCDTSIDSAGAVARCVHAGCNMSAHLTCLSKDFLRDSSSLLPITGVCRGCNQQLHWGDVIKKMKGKALKRSTEDRHPLQSIDMNIPDKPSKKAPKAKKPATKSTRKKNDTLAAPPDDADDIFPSNLTSTANPTTTLPKKATKKTSTTSALSSTTKPTSLTTSYATNSTSTHSSARISATNFTNTTSSASSSLSSYSNPSKSNTQTSSTPFSTSLQPAKPKQKPTSNIGFLVGGLDELYSSDECEAIKLKSRSYSSSSSNSVSKSKKPNFDDDDCITLL